MNDRLHLPPGVEPSPEQQQLPQQPIAGILIGGLECAVAPQYIAKLELARAGGSGGNGSGSVPMYCVQALLAVEGAEAERSVMTPPMEREQAKRALEAISKNAFMLFAASPTGVFWLDDILAAEEAAANAAQAAAEQASEGAAQPTE